MANLIVRRDRSTDVDCRLMAGVKRDDMQWLNDFRDRKRRPSLLRRMVRSVKALRRESAELAAARARIGRWQ
jgi:hypothetical protein